MEEKKLVSLTECPRDAMQGIKDFIPTATKIKYLNLLSKCGFSRIDFGSFVSPQAIPQLADTAKVLGKLDNITTPLLAIVANYRGAREAAEFDEIEFLGFPFSVSETFQLKNTNKTIKEAYSDVVQIQELCTSRNKKLLIYISMGFGNPYGDFYSEEIVEQWIDKLSATGIKDFNLSDTIGIAEPESITRLFSQLKTQTTQLNLGAHFHSTPSTQLEKIEAAFEAGCRMFDGAIGGFGGCPMATVELTGNLSTEALINFFGKDSGINHLAFKEAQVMATKIFGTYH